ncbi:MAG: universal stress protein [Anaerolineae bacterium]|jgi:nucleotide-binding universal stress UspA family protein|nr:universal stress protein [Anaerolineae bacterium]
MLKHLLVPLDGSALSEDALAYARQIVAPDGKITLATAVEMPYMMPDTLYPVYAMSFDAAGNYDREGVEPNRLITLAENYLQNIAEGLFNTAQLKVEIRAQIAEPASFIVQLARDLDVDAICISTHGRSGFSRWLFGSVTQKVLTAAPCAVLVIPSKERLAKKEQATSEVNFG